MVNADSSVAARPVESGVDVQWVGKHAKIVFIDGPLSTGEPRYFVGLVVAEDDHFYYLRKRQTDKVVSVSKTFIVKIEGADGHK